MASAGRPAAALESRRRSHRPLRGLIQSLEPKSLVGALASGADIFFAKAALAEGIKLEVLLPFDVAIFRETSVEPAGEPWISDYDRITSSPDVKVADLGLDPFRCRVLP